MKPFDYNKYIKNNPLLKEYKEDNKKQINEFMHIPLQIAAEKIGDFASKINRKYMDAEKKVIITVDKSVEKQTDVRYAQFLEDLRKSLTAGKDALKSVKGLEKVGKDAVQININSRDNGIVWILIHNTKEAAADQLSGESRNKFIEVLAGTILKNLEKGKITQKGNQLEYDLNKLYPIEKIDGKETAKIANPAPELQKQDK